jgi:hypothetical protein
MNTRRFTMNILVGLLGAIIISAIMVNVCHADNTQCAIVEVTPPILPEGDKGTITVVCPADTVYDPGKCTITTNEKYGFDAPIRYIILECPADVIYDVQGSL